MKGVWSTLNDAFFGWRAILASEPGWRAHFRLSNAGLVTALALFYLFAFIAMMLASLNVGVPTPEGFFNVMLMQSFWLVALLVSIWATRRAVPTDAPFKALFVPGIYALIAYLVMGTLLSLVLGILLPLLWLGLVYMLFRLGRVVAGWSPGVSLAFAILSVVLLVGLPMTLYMLATSFAVPAA